jgi:hypothetical protein
MRAVGLDAKTSFGRVIGPSVPAPTVVSGGQAVAVPVPEPSYFALHLAYVLLFPCLLVGVLVAGMLALRRLRRPRWRRAT